MMIFRRLAQHLHEQNWTAITIEFVLLVVGVFLGIQVANWNDERKELGEEALVLSRLGEELRSLIAIQREELADNRTRAELVVKLNPVLFGQEAPRDLSPEECFAITSSHVFRPPTDELPILDELQDSGRFDLIRSAALKERLREYTLLRERGRGQYREITNELFRLHSRHPELLWIIRTPIEPASSNQHGSLSGEGYRWQSNCDVPAMRASRQFLNEYVDNASRRHSHMSMYESRIDALRAIEGELSTLAGAGHDFGRAP